MEMGTDWGVEPTAADEPAFGCDVATGESDGLGKGDALAGQSLGSVCMPFWSRSRGDAERRQANSADPP